ncbi:MAG: hypothetical protein AB7E55_34115 [Pigmentiphaga sp.]
MPTSNSEIYKLLTEFNGKLGELGGTLKALDDKVDEIKDDISTSESTSSAYRQGVREELAKIVIRQTHLEADVSSLKRKIEGVEEVTGQVKTLSNKAEGAGTAGRLLLRAGIAIVGFVGWALGIYTWLTGRPPP